MIKKRNNTHDLSCPYCAEQMRIKSAHCTKCEVTVEADFESSRLARLPAKDAAFLAEYVLAGFSIKDMEKRVSMSYPAIRSRLNKLRDKIAGVSVKDDYRQTVLNRLERGEISTDDAITLLG